MIGERAAVQGKGTDLSALNEKIASYLKSDGFTVQTQRRVRKGR